MEESLIFAISRHVDGPAVHRSGPFRLATAWIFGTSRAMSGT